MSTVLTSPLLFDVVVAQSFRVRLILFEKSFYKTDHGPGSVTGFIEI